MQRDLTQCPELYCKSSEFRDICLDCRVYRADDNILSKPKKCKYDPYSNNWEK